MMGRRGILFLSIVVLVLLGLAACSGGSSNLNKYVSGRTLVLNVVSIERAPELRYSTIDPTDVIRTWRIVSSGSGQELVLVRMKVENHTAIKAVFDVGPIGVRVVGAGEHATNANNGDRPGLSR